MKTLICNHCTLQQLLMPCFSGSCSYKRNSLFFTEIPVKNFCLNQLKRSSETIQVSLMFSWPASKQTDMAVPSATSPGTCKNIWADPKAETGVWEQVSSFLAAVGLAYTSLNVCEMTTQLTGDTKTGQEKNLFSIRRWLLSPQIKDNWRDGGKREVSQPVTRRKQVLWIEGRL